MHRTDTAYLQCNVVWNGIAFPLSHSIHDNRFRCGQTRQQVSRRLKSSFLQSRHRFEPDRRNQLRFERQSLCVSLRTEFRRQKVEVIDIDDDVFEKVSDSETKRSSTRSTDHLFFDRAYINVKGGDGGTGVVAFHREKGVQKGGPSGGSGGKGGDIIFEVDKGLNTLLKFRGQIHFRAADGKNGLGSWRTGSQGSDIIVNVPDGTVVRTSDGKLLTDLSLEHERTRATVAQGGRGGRGNASFKTHLQHTPRLAELGEPGEERWIQLELKIVADVGIVGVPNAGKSTFLASVTAAKPKIADYPFTTIVPNLGVARVDANSDRTVVLVDIPGLLEGAHDGVGMGFDFLRHVERTRLLLHIVDGSGVDPLGDFEAIQQELQLFRPHLAEKPQAVVFNKMDLEEARNRWPEFQKELQSRGFPVISASAATGESVGRVMAGVQKLLDQIPPPSDLFAEELMEANAQQEIQIANEKDFTIRRNEFGQFIVQGVHIERVVRMTNWDYHEAILRFQRILRATGIEKELKKVGVKDGDVVVCGGRELVWENHESRYD